MMSKIERVLAPDSTEMPDCKCGAEMHLIRSRVVDNSSGTEIRTYGCHACEQEFILTAWAEAAD